jgi:hypothetical protein
MALGIAPGTAPGTARRSPDRPKRSPLSCRAPSYAVAGRAPPPSAHVSNQAGGNGMSAPARCAPVTDKRPIAGQRSLAPDRGFRYIVALDTGARARSSAGEHYVDIVGVRGSIPLAPTSLFSHLAATNRKRSRKWEACGKQERAFRSAEPLPGRKARSAVSGQHSTEFASMAIVDDYAAISAEVRRIQAERSRQEKPAGEARSEPASQHRMRATIAGDLLYRRLVSQQARRRRGS